MVLNSVGLTGATGMLGRHVWAALEDAGISGISASWNGHIANGTRRWELTNWLGLEELDKVFPRVQAVIHAGAMVPQSTESISDGAMFDANVRSCVNLGLW